MPRKWKTLSYLYRCGYILYFLNVPKFKSRVTVKVQGNIVVSLKIIEALIRQYFRLIAGSSSSYLSESAKLRALCAKNVVTCQLFCVLTCSRANVPCMLTCSRANVPCVLTFQRALRAYVLTCQRASFDATIFSFAAVIAEVVDTVDKVYEFNYCLYSVR